MPALPLPLTKFYSPWDLLELKSELEVVDRFFKEATPQHPARRWEYAMGLAALQRWWGETPTKKPIGAVDVGGADSPFPKMLEAAWPTPYGAGGVEVIDPRGANPRTLQEFVRAGGRSSAVFCISTIEHVDALPLFLEDLAAVTLPGGLLFLTSDAWDQEGEDRAHWHWDRKRIWTKETWHKLQLRSFEVGFQPLGSTDLTWIGETLENWGYTLVSMALRKV